MLYRAFGRDLFLRSSVSLASLELIYHGQHSSTLPHDKQKSCVLVLVVEELSSNYTSHPP